MVICGKKCDHSLCEHMVRFYCRQFTRAIMSFSPPRSNEQDCELNACVTHSIVLCVLFTHNCRTFVSLSVCLSVCVAVAEAAQVHSVELPLEVLLSGVIYLSGTHVTSDCGAGYSQVHSCQVKRMELEHGCVLYGWSILFTYYSHT